MCCQSDVFLICSCLVYLHVFSVVEYVELSGPPYKFLTTVIYGHWDHLFTKRPYPWLQQDSREGEKSPTPSLFPSIPSFLPETAQHSWSLPPLTIPLCLTRFLTFCSAEEARVKQTAGRVWVAGPKAQLFTGISPPLPEPSRCSGLWIQHDLIYFKLYIYTWNMRVVQNLPSHIKLNSFLFEI